MDIPARNLIHWKANLRPPQREIDYVENTKIGLFLVHDFESDEAHYVYCHQGSNRELGFGFQYDPEDVMTILEHFTGESAIRQLMELVRLKALTAYKSTTYTILMRKHGHLIPVKQLDKDDGEAYLDELTKLSGGEGVGIDGAYRLYGHQAGETPDSLGYLEMECICRYLAVRCLTMVLQRSASSSSSSTEELTLDDMTFIVTPAGIEEEPEEEDGVYMFGLLPAHYVSLREYKKSLTSKTVMEPYSESESECEDKEAQE